MLYTLRTLHLAVQWGRAWSSGVLLSCYVPTGPPAAPLLLLSERTHGALHAPDGVSRRSQTPGLRVEVTRPSFRPLDWLLCSDGLTLCRGWHYGQRAVSCPSESSPGHRPSVHPLSLRSPGQAWEFASRPRPCPRAAPPPAFSPPCPPPPQVRGVGTQPQWGCVPQSPLPQVTSSGRLTPLVSARTARQGASA